MTPFDAMRYLIAEANYGGRVTDDWDRRLVNVYINQYICEDAIDMENYRMSELDEYYAPPDGKLPSYADFIKTMPTADHPGAFGQHPNADISSQIEDTVRPLIISLLITASLLRLDLSRLMRTKSHTFVSLPLAYLCRLTC
jgi:dynein heavy chain